MARALDIQRTSHWLCPHSLGHLDAAPLPELALLLRHCVVCNIHSFSFPGWKAMGCSVTGFRRSMWVVAVAVVLAAAAILLAGNLHTLHHPRNLTRWVLAFSGYTVWSLASSYYCRAISSFACSASCPAPLGPLGGSFDFCAGPLTQSHPCPGHAHLGIDGLPRVSPLAQHLAARDGACHLRHLHCHYCPRFDAPQYAGRSRLPNLSGATTHSPQPERPHSVNGSVGQRRSAYAPICAPRPAIKDARRRCHHHIAPVEIGGPLVPVRQPKN